MERTANPPKGYETFGRVRTRAVLVLKAEVTRFDGEIIDPRTGVVLASEEAYPRGVSLYSVGNLRRSGSGEC